MAQFSFLDELFVLDTETLITSAVSGCCRPNVRLIRSWQSCLELMNPGPWAAMWSPTLCYIWKRCVLLAMWVFLHTYTHKQITVWTQEYKKGQISNVTQSWLCRSLLWMRWMYCTFSQHKMYQNYGFSVDWKCNSTSKSRLLIHIKSKEALINFFCWENGIREFRCMLGGMAKGTVHLKMNNLSSFTHTHAVLNMHEFLSSVERKWKIFLLATKM